MRFAFDMEAEVFEKASPNGQDRRIGGIVSTSDMDRQHETLVQEGLDFEPFLKSGWFNDNHDSSTDALIGYPTLATMRELPGGRKGWYVEGYLLKGCERADRIWELAQALQKSDRKLGFSVEGSVVERDSKNANVVRKAVVREVAITRCPVNTSATLSVLAKSLTAGSAVGNPGTSPGEGFPLRAESLEAKPTKKKKKRLAKSEAINLLMTLNPAVTRTQAEQIVEYTLRWHAAEENNDE